MSKSSQKLRKNRVIAHYSRGLSRNRHKRWMDAAISRCAQQLSDAIDRKCYVDISFTAADLRA